MKYQSSRLKIIANIKVCFTHTNRLKTKCPPDLLYKGIKIFMVPLMLCTKFQGHLLSDSRDVFLIIFFIL